MLMSLGVMWMASFLNQGFCASSLIAEPSQSSACTPWVRRESASPLFDASHNALYVGGSDGFLHEVNSQSGETRRILKLSGNLQAKPLQIENNLYFATDNGTAMSVNVDTWKIVWQTRLDAEVYNTMVKDHSMLYVTSGLSTIYAINQVDGSIVWYQKRPLPSRIIIGVQSNPLIYESTGRKFLASGHPSGVVNFYDAKNGHSLFNVTVGDLTAEFPDVAADPVLCDGSVIVASFNRGVASLDPHTGALHWLRPEKGVTRLTATSARVFASGGKFVVGLDAKLGESRWRFVFDKGAPTPMLVKDDVLYVGSDRGALFVLDEKTGAPRAYLGSGLGFTGAIDFSSKTLFAVTTPGRLLSLSSSSSGISNRRSVADGGAFGW